MEIIQFNRMKYFSGKLFWAGKRFRSGGMMRALFYLCISPKFQHEQLGFSLEQSNYFIP